MRRRQKKEKEQSILGSGKVDDSSIAVFLTAEDNITFTLKGLKVGSTKATVTATDGTKQDFFITVRKNDSWL